MGKGGKYLSKKVPVGRKKKILPTILIVLVVIIALCVGAALLYYNYLLGLIRKPTEVTVPVENAMEMTDPGFSDATLSEDETLGATVETSSTGETWPVIVSDENITNVMLVGQAARPGETALIADTMILCSINRETKTLTMTSLMRDMRLQWPEFIDSHGKPHTGNNRINMAYNMGYRWRGDVSGGMDLLESIVEYNFGIPVDYTVEVNFESVETIIRAIGGVEVDISQEELDYLQKNYPGYFDDATVGMNTIGGYRALCYARMRKVGHGDYERTERQREVITSMLNNLRTMNIFKLHGLFTELLPVITTDMSSQQITNYALEFIPMLKDLKIQSQRIPFDGNEMSVPVEIDGVMDYQIAPRDLKATAKQLQESIGMTPVS